MAQMSKRQIFILAIVLLLVLGAVGAWFAMGSGTSVNTAAGALAPDKVGENEHVLGSPNAPVTMIEYFAQSCSVCALFDQAVFPLLKEKYIDTGKVRYVMRLYPLFPIDGPAYKLDLCMPKEEFFHAADLLFRNQAQWDTAEYKDADPQGLVKMARIMGLTQDQANACMSSTEADAEINRIAKEGQDRYAIDHTPTFLIDFKKADSIRQQSWTEVQSALDKALAAKGAK
jgi:protein-disulfide isomerase